MANLATLKAALNAAIYQNNQNAITGEALNTILNSIIDTLGAGYRYAGVATPSANPGTIDNRVFYFATAAGTYTNFGAVQLDGKKLHIFIYDTTWHDIALDVPTTAAIPVIAGSGTNSMQGKGGAAAAGGDSFAFGHLTNADDDSIVAENDGAVAIGFARNEGSIQAYGDGAVACGLADNANVEAGGEGSHAEGCAIGGSILALNPGAHAEGSAVGANITASGTGSHAEGSTDFIGSDITASGEGAHAEGSGTTASGDVSHAEGSATTASADAAHAEGDGTVASAGASHAEGFNTAASASSAHAEGYETVAQNVAEHAEGKYNASHKKTTGTAAEQAAGSTLSSVGCGTSANNRKNAVEVMQNGDVYVKGVGGYDGTNPAQAGVLNIEIFLGYLVLLAPQNRNRVDWSAESIIIDTNFGYCLTPFFDRVGGAELFRTYLSSMIDDSLHITSDFNSVDYLGLSGDARIENGSLDSGAVCCIYNNNGDQYYFIYEA